MIAATGFGTLGTLWGLAVGVKLLGFEPSFVLGVLFRAWIAGLVALIATQELGALAGWIRRVLGSTFRTWLFFLAVYFSILLSGYPELLDFRTLGWFLPALMGLGGYTALPFGPYQDWRVAQRQRRARRG